MDADHIEAGQEWELEEIERDERAARERLEAARERNLMVDGEIPHEHHELLHRLEAEWKQARERLEHARRARGA